MLNKLIPILLMVSASVICMEINECTVRITIDGEEAFARKVTTILKTNDPNTQSIIKDLLTKDSPKKSSADQVKQKAVILRKINESDEK